MSSPILYFFIKKQYFYITFFINYLTFVTIFVILKLEMLVIPKQLRREYAELDKRGRIAGDFFYLNCQISIFDFRSFSQRF